ncbi:hypothetical protein [Senegalia massiliensis]|uniref:Uncharacterized protein n=1 Tax=Senegalia massiliensis TaxID=1720316 RepID=A0A845R549_9CLOT|nr:hypothetical protein [Senegalia massiliensis]NBI07633.1 hypothetical protein [Senegalia massiliensis]
MTNVMFDKIYREKIQNFIDKRMYTYDIKDILKGYNDYKRGWYVSVTMKDCITHLETPIKKILELDINKNYTYNKSKENFTNTNEGD